MWDFIKRNLVWISIVLCVIGIGLSIVGIPTKQPICFFIGVILALPTVFYIVYQVFFDKGTAEINLDTNKDKPSNGNVTSILERKENLVLMNNEEDDLEPLYNGFATEQEIENQLREVTDQARERAIADSPMEGLSLLDEYEEPEIIDTPILDDFTDLEPTETHERIMVEAPQMYEEQPKPIEPVPVAVSELEAQAPAQQPQEEMLGGTIIRINPTNAELRRQRALEKKQALSQENLERYLQHYFIEVAACFMLDRNIYKDKYGIAPYNKFAINKTSMLPEYAMTATKGRLYKFCTYLVDAERFITHTALYDDFVAAIEKGISISRVSETLHPIYRKKYKKDFLLNLSNREDWDNVMILVYNNYILNNDNFKDVFTRIPFEIPVAYNEQNITDYLSDVDVQERFAQRFPALAEIGMPTIWDAMFICFVNSIKQKLPMEALENAILKEHKKIARALKRADNQRQKRLKAS